MTSQTRICVFCSTVSGTSPRHLEAARSLAHELHNRGIQLIYGAGKTGMMGELAKTLVSLSGPNSVLGIIPSRMLLYERPASEPRSMFELIRKIMPIGGKAKNKSASKLLLEDTYGRIEVVSDMTERKKRMAKLVATGGPGSGFIGLSGGFGTMDELMEMVTWNQLGVHDKGVCLYNVEGYWDGVLDWLEHAIDTGFMRDDGRGIMVGKETAADCVEWLKAYSKNNAGVGMKFGDV